MSEQPPISDVPPTTPPAAPPAPEPAPNVAALVAEVQKERKARQALEAERAELAKAAAERDSLSEQHKRYSAYVAEQNAAALQALPEPVREQIAALTAGKGEIETAQIIKLIRDVQAQAPAAAPVPPPPIPGGVQAQPAATPADEVPPDVAEWVRANRPDWQGLPAATIIKLHKNHGPKKA